ncbi:MAG: hypothetical protein ACYC63_17910 [Armatimonadota bacterium]
MLLRILMITLLVTVLCAPLWAAWPFINDLDERAEVYGAVVTEAIAASQKALEANELAKARYPLLAVSDLCVPSGGHDPKVTEAVVTAYKAACAKAWVAGQVPDEKTFDATVKEYGPKFDGVYMNAFYLADNAGNTSSSRLFEDFAKGNAKHPAAEVLAIEFSGKSILPEDFQKYIFQGKHGSPANEIQQTIANIYGGPDAVRRVCKTTVVPNALESAADELANIDPDGDDAQMMSFRAGMVEDDYLKWVRWSDPENAKCKELQAKVDALKQKARELRAAQIKQNRMPPDNYPLADKAELKAAMAKVFELQPGAKIVKVVIPGKYWVEKPFVWVGLNNADAGWYKLIDGAVLCQYADGTFHVHPVTYGKRWIGNDNYGDVEVRGWADQYEILPQYAK